MKNIQLNERFNVNLQINLNYLIMKFTKLCVLLLAITAFAACKKEEEKTETIETTTVEKETVIVKDTVTATPQEKDGTSVKVSGDGVEVKSKEVDVEVKK